MTGGRVVVLGPTGRNFAAGMSGGVAYVLDTDGAFPARCNRDLVELETVDDDDLGVLADLVAQHARCTGSAVAERVLDRWEETTSRWVKVMPRDYKRALRDLARRRAEEAPAATVAG
jgi:glutamate synthase domain-containing protein 3